MKIVLFKDFTIYKNIFPIDDNGRKVDLYKFQNCTCTGINLHYPNVLINARENLVLPLLEKTMSLNMGTIYEKQDMEFNYIKKEAINVCKTPLFYFIYNTDNYFHFLYDSLPYLISYLHLKQEIPELKLLMQYPNEQKKNFYPFINEFFEILNITNEEIIMVNDMTIYNDIFISTSYTHDIDSNLPPRKEIYDFYKHIVLSVKAKYIKISVPKKIYVSRRTWLHNDFSNIGTNYTTRRRMTNEDEFVEKLQNEGYTEVFTENLSTIDKILYFANATHVVGAIGGGLSNVLFSPKTTKLEAIVSPTFLDVNGRFKYSLECVDVHYNYDTSHIEKKEFKTYMRVKTKDGNIIGEIEKVNDDKLFVSYSDGSNTGWNSLNEYKSIELNIKDVVKLDCGLNSPWYLNYI